MSTYQCPGCRRTIGPMFDGTRAGLYRCPHTGQVYGPQELIRPEPPKKRRPRRRAPEAGES